MRQRKSQEIRRAEILATAQKLFLNRGYGACQMEDIRRDAGLSRGGLYHHFDGKPAILAALVETEVLNLQSILENSDNPISTMILGGAGHLNAPAGIIAALSDPADLRLYLSLLERSITEHLHAPLVAAIERGIRDAQYGSVNPEHAAEMFLAINAHLNRRVILDGWNDRESAKFAATALTAFAHLLGALDEFADLIKKLDGV